MAESVSFVLRNAPNGQQIEGIPPFFLLFCFYSSKLAERKSTFCFLLGLLSFRLFTFRFQ